VKNHKPFADSCGTFIGMSSQRFSIEEKQFTHPLIESNMGVMTFGDIE
jgi:hypothetical protein